MLGKNWSVNVLSLAKGSHWRCCDKAAIGWTEAAPSSAAALLLLIAKRRPTETVWQPTQRATDEQCPG